MTKQFTVALLLALTGSLSVLAQGNYIANTANNTNQGTYNTLLGPGAGANGSLTGDRNAVTGYNAGFYLTSGNRNSFFGVDAGKFTNTGYENTFMGFEAGISNTSGSSNTLIGRGAGYANTTGVNSTFVGYKAGYSTTSSGYGNAFVGAYAGYSNISGGQNVFFGTDAGAENTTGSSNTFLGTYSGNNNSTGNLNTYVGNSAGRNNSTGTYNTSIGANAGGDNSSGSNNTYLGYDAGVANYSGYSNVALGGWAGYRNTAGHSNVMIGDSAGLNNTVSANVFIGSKAGYTNTTGINNTFLGYQADAGANNLNNATAIGNNAKVNISNALVLGNGANVGIGNSAPTARLHITTGRSGQSGLRLENLTSATTASVTNQTKFLTVDASGNVILGSLNNSARVSADESLWQRSGNLLQNAGGESVLIGDNISQTPAGYKLYVEQGILTEKVKVAVKNTNEWSDYVFAPAYRLAPLGEVGEYIKANKHLPGVLSAEEMVARGNDLHQTDAKLLEKIEELTLYTIELEKAREQQQTEIDELKQVVSQLVKRH